MIKFGALLEGLDAIGIAYDYFCTGHYASVVRPEGALSGLYESSAAVSRSTDGTSSETLGDVKPAMIRQASDTAKDQTYFLYRVPTSTLEKVRFPLAGYTKEDVRRIAREKGLLSASRGESQDFMPDEYAEALFGGKFSPVGDFVDMSGNILGRHRGIERYTVGQRRGLGVSAVKPLYVQSIRKDANQVVLAEEERLYCSALIADDAVWAGDYAPSAAFRGDVKIRLGSKPAPAIVTPLDGKKIQIDFDSPQRAVAPGQSAVIYIDGIVAGGGIISEGIHEKNLS
jgi:tRNA-specific 2-thiouridylase